MEFLEQINKLEKEHYFDKEDYDEDETIEIDKTIQNDLQQKDMRFNRYVENFSVDKASVRRLLEN